MRPVFLILKMNSITMGVSKAPKKFAKWKGEMFLCVFRFCSLLEGYGAFYRPGGGRITMSYYFCIHEGIYMTSGARLEIVGS
jgi:hypothetical protein